MNHDPDILLTLDEIRELFAELGFGDPTGEHECKPVVDDEAQS